MAKSGKSSVGWGACKGVVRSWPAAGVVALVKELYELNAENRQFLEARLLPEQSAQTLDAAKRALSKLLSVDAVFRGAFRHAEVKRLVDRYAKASDDAAMIVDILITDLEIGFATFGEVGDFEPMVDHLYATLKRLCGELEKLPSEALGPFVARLDQLAEKWGGSFGYGISDELADVAFAWRERAGWKEMEE